MKGVFSYSVYSEYEASTAVFLLLSTAMIFLMQVGFTLFEYGLVRAKNAQFILVKNLLICCTVVVAWWLFGYGLSYGETTQFIGNDPWFFATQGFEQIKFDHYLKFVLEFAYVVTCATAFSLPLAERTSLIAYLVYVFILAGFIYPTLVAWIWGGGWLQDKGFHDFAGSGVIHMTAGVSAFWGILILGERYGKSKYRANI